MIRVSEFLRRRRSRILLVCAVFVGLLLGYFVAEIASGVLERTTEMESYASTTIRPQHQSNVESFSRPIESCLGFFRDSKLFSGSQSQFSLIDNLGDVQLIALLDQCQKSESNVQINVVQELVLAKLAQRNPTTALEFVWSFHRHRWKTLLNIVFDEWSAFDLKGALQAAHGLDEPKRSAALRSVFKNPDVLSSNDIQSLVVQLGIESFLRHERSDVRAIQLLEDPKAAWNCVIQDDILNEEQEDLLVQIVYASLQSGDFIVLNRLIDDILESNYALFDRILASTISFDEYRIAEFALNMSPERQSLFFPRLIMVWPRSDLHGALEVSWRIAKNSIRERTQSRIVQLWAEENPQELLSNIQQLPEHLRQDSVLYAIRKIVQTSPQLATNEIARLRPILGYIEDSTEYLLVREWAEKNPNEALSWVNANAVEGSEKRARMMQRILSNYALVDPDKAMSIARSEQPHAFHGMTGLETEVIGSLASSGQLDTAIDLLEHVRESALSLSCVRIGVRLIQSDRTKEAIELSKRLPSEEQADYFSNITGTWLSTNIADLVNSIAELPSKHIQEKVAEKILLASEQSPFLLTNEQLTHVRSFLLASSKENTIE
ncbi:MAG: hypothetical protein OXG24_07135 [Gammaproteobacteria bacterium]|nr:hypothetical protein [Gammaproteobacteria bacterium]